MKYVLAIDQGTSSTKSIIFDENSELVAKGFTELETSYFGEGFVEQNPEGIFENVLDSVADCLSNFKNQGLEVTDICSAGISNQRETFVLWDKAGKALSPAVVWSDKRSVQICQDLIEKGQNDLIKEKTGLIIDPYFSATKLLWLLKDDENLKARVEAGEVYFGTVDCWLLYKMTDGASFKTDYTNASRTLLYNINELKWDAEILELWGLQNLNLPEVCSSSSNFGDWYFEWNADDADSFGNADFRSSLKICVSKSASSASYKIPITALIGDSHSAAFGEGCFEKGTAKATLGTGSSIMMNIGDKPIKSDFGMLTTICWSTENQIQYALEGAIVACGSTIEWLKSELNLFAKAAETEAMAKSVKDNGGVYFIPAFSGLGAPHWQMDRKASIHGMTFGTSKNHIVRAALESIPYQIKDVVAAMEEDMQAKLKFLAVNGGLTKNQFVLNFITDLLEIPLEIQKIADISALGAAYLSGLKSGVYKDIEQLKGFCQKNKHRVEPDLEKEQIKATYKKWQELIKS
ncbi:FGGY family carbohydrate kinase [uncultured Arcticibacterium sp.]|uniref:FGGY family carbohydrate kinase n=1 Tax=uncultured Arcticibacterium sp. TaxID=2173042 RepID=UPI0030F4B5A6